MPECPYCQRTFTAQSYSKPESALTMHLGNCSAKRKAERDTEPAYLRIARESLAERLNKQMEAINVDDAEQQKRRPQPQPRRPVCDG